MGLARVALIIWGLPAVACTTTDVLATALDGADAGATDRPSLPCDAMFCASFEEPLEPSLISENGGTVTRSCGGAASGECFMTAAWNQPGGTGILRLELADAPQFFVRMYVRVPEALTLTDVAILHLGGPADDVGINVDIQEEDRFELFLPENGDSVDSSPSAFPRAQWTCLQLDVAVDDTAGSALLRLDGSAVAQIEGVDTRPPNGVELFTVGADWSADTQAPGSLEFDDVALDTSPVGCL